MKKWTIIIGPLLLFLLWEMITEFHIVDSFFFPNPIASGIALFHLLSSDLMNDIFATLWRTLEAFCIAMIIGVPLGLFLGKNEKIYRSIEFIIDFFRSMPA